MAISIADAPGPFLYPFFLMPDLKAAPPVRHSLFHRLGLRSWLGRDGEGIESHSQFIARELSRQRLAGLPSSSAKRVHDDVENDVNYDDDIDGVTSVADSEQLGSSLPQPSPSNVTVGLPRAPTFKRQNSERRDHLTPSESGLGHRRAYSADRQGDIGPCRTNSPLPPYSPRNSVPDLPTKNYDISAQASPTLINDEPSPLQQDPEQGQGQPQTDLASEYGPPSEGTIDNELEAELDKKWILNLSMRFRDKSDREKFFITYAEAPNRWRKVTVSCDYRNAEPDSLESDLKKLQYHREKNAHIYESIRESIDEIQFYDTVTNLKLETRDGRLHVHVTEDVNEVIIFPPISSVEYLNPLFIPESELDFDSHLSGFVYRVKYHGKDYVKKEITGPDTVEEFLYEINALHALLDSTNVINFRAIVVDDSGTLVKGLLIDYAEQGALADLFYDFKGELSWKRRERWAKQIIKGLGDIHEAGFVQGDFTVSNVVVDEHDDAKIIDINRRGCPIGWEPPEFAKKLESKQRISMYIGVKSDLYQLGMTLWGLAMEEDEPGRQPRPLLIPEDMKIPAYFRRIVDICLSERPQGRLSAKDLLALFDDQEEEDDFPVPGAEIPRYAPMQNLNGVYPGHPHTNYNYQLNSMYMDQHPKSMHYAPVPTGDRLRYQHIGVEPVIMPPSRNSPDFHCVNNNLQTAHHHGEHGIPESPHALDHNGQFLPPGGHWANGHHPVPYYNPAFVRPALASHHATLGLSELELLDRQDRETESDPRFDDFGPTDLPPHSESGYTIDEDYVHELQGHDETEPSYLVDDHYPAPNQAHIPLDSLPTPEDHDEPQLDYLDEVTDANQADSLNGQEENSYAEPVFDLEDLSASQLPINPDFMKTANPDLPTFAGYDYFDISPSETPLELPVSNDTLLTSGLPINPRHSVPEFKPMSLNKYGDDDFLSSNLPINPAYIDPLDRDISPRDRIKEVSRDDTGSAIPGLQVTFQGDLFRSALPINPCHSTQAFENYRNTPSRPDQLPKNLGTPKLEYISKRKISKNTNIGTLASSDASRVTSNDLLTSLLPINPQFCCQDLSAPLSYNDLFTSTLPINPRYKGQDIRHLRNLGCHVRPRSSAKHPPAIPEPLRQIPPQQQSSASSRDDLFLSILPINPQRQDPQPEIFTISVSEGANGDLLSSKLPINPAFSHPTTLRRMIPSSQKLNKATTNTPPTELFTSVLPINPAARI
ncbi:TKL protein kinase [Nannizzia gypsea CBS 118893]|uniref:TKL protein kinase n=1 Tax=Arthroderma gypseum (strain ATCC MYA-4604 / CBS 118893) TaxID=535722 RepID=E4V3H5_ARTGP|nr:TKL protein kinase [Nannizzia gypsea CBS 118893]EFR04549.1 TKL protein kinase [Nannizzia gypsea CBS 118893]